MPADQQVSLFSVFLLGISLGLTACAVTCLPFIGTLVFGKAAGRKSGMIDASLFLGGRLIAYAMLGGLAGAFGAWFVKVLADGLGNLAIGFAAAFSAALLFTQARDRHSACSHLAKLANFSPLLLGFALTLIPCAPLATLLATAASGESLAQGALLGFVFGLGSLLTPMLVLIPAGASIAGHLREEQPWLTSVLSIGAAMVLLLIGCRRIAAVSPKLAVATGACCALLGLWHIYRSWPKPAIPPAGQPLVFHRSSAD